MKVTYCFILCLGLLLTACSTAPSKPMAPRQPEASVATPDQAEQPTTKNTDAESRNAKVCRQVMQHDESKYTAGGLYAPGVSDAPPVGELDISLLQEPMPRNEAKSKYGNKSPYTVLKKKYYVRDSAEGYKERGIASWYGTKFHGRQTSSQEIYDMCQFSAAHKTLPIPSYARVTRLDTGQSVIVRVNDRGPFHDGRIIDLSFAAATKLGINKTGTAKVEVEAITDAEALSVPAIIESTTAEKNYLQVASFTNEDNAKALKERLQDQDIDDVFIQKHKTDGNAVWRVRIGPMNEGKVAKTQQKLSQIGLKSVRVGAE